MKSTTRRIATPVGASVILAAALTGVASAKPANPSAATDHSRILRFTQQFNDGFGLDLGDPGASGGDEFGGSATWYSGSRAVADVGFVCTTTSLDPPEDQCVLSARFANGVLTAQTLFDERSTGPTDYAITGGSKAYRDAAGYLTIGNGATEITIHLDTSD